jgi:hypothetical protein
VRGALRAPVLRSGKGSRKRMCASARLAPRAKAFRLLRSRSGSFVPLPDAADASHITASRNDLGACHERERHGPLRHRLRIPAPSGRRRPTPSEGRNERRVRDSRRAGISFLLCEGTAPNRWPEKFAEAS